VIEPASSHRKGSHQVHLHVGEVAAGYKNRLHRCGWLKRHLPMSAILALLAPGTDVRGDALPDKPGSDEAKNSTCPWMGDVMDAVEDIAALQKRDNGPDEAFRDVT
jgi:hypothetical protein